MREMYNKNSLKKIVVEKGILEEILDYSCSNVSLELGGFLVGDYFDDGLLSITDYIPAKYTQSSHSSLTFTHDTWISVSDVMEQQFKNKRIVGWHHTHPGFGVFLSEYDLFIHRNFFNLPFQVAYVIDPISKTSGFFYWELNHIEQIDKTLVVEKE